MLAGWRDLDQVAAELKAAGGAGAAKEHASARQVELFVRRLVFGAVGDLAGLKDISERADAA